MVAISQIINNGLILASPLVYKSLATPNQAATEQYNLVKYLGGAGPYIQHPGFGVSTDVPEQCTVEQVHLFSRHGERYPSKKKGGKFEKLLKKLTNLSEPLVGELAFINDYEFFVEDTDNYDKSTTPANSESPYAGTTSALSHGVAFRSRYNELFENALEPLTVFTSNSGRCHETARYFTRGLLGDDYGEDTANFAVIAEEKENGANSLTPKIGCKDYDKKLHNDYIDEYDDSYLKAAAERITKGNDVSLSKKETALLFDWCAYELNVKGYSPFCNLFTNHEYVKYSYGDDLDRYYSSGPGNNGSVVVGAPYWKATLAYLKEENPSQKAVLSFSHSSDLEPVHAALGLVAPEEPLPADRIQFPKQYVYTEIIPMSARLYTEKLKCGDESYVRFLVNDAVVPLKNCQDGPGFSCKLSDFESYINSRIGDIDYNQQCGVEGVPSEVTYLWDYKTTDYSAPDIDS